MRTKTVHEGSKENVARVQVQQHSLPPDHTPKPLGMTAALLNLQRTHGNRFVQRMLMTTATIQRQCACGGICAKRQSQSTNPEQDIFQQILQRKGSGQPLDTGVRAFMETRFGQDFSGVYVHTDAQTAQTAQQLSAIAYTVGRDIFFGEGQYQPQSQEGRRLLAHELTHVVQQEGQPAMPQTGLQVSEPGDRFEQEAERVAEQISNNEISIPPEGEEEQFVDIVPKNSCKKTLRSSAFQSQLNDSISELPVEANAGPFSMVETPNGGGSAEEKTTSSCDEPLSMTKVTSGTFQGGLTMGSYYPDLGGGFWQDGGTAGTFDTGTRAGSKAQLYGTIPSPCRPELFSLAQTVTRRRSRIDGVTDPTEGQTFDDIAKSGRDASRPPFRQDWLGGGYNISMADPPSIGYSSTTNADYDRDFVTSLIGPGGRKSVSWSISVRIVNGKVTQNTIS